MPSATDRIEKKILLRASRDRVWRALTDREQFGAWFGMRLDAPFEAGKSVSGLIVGTQVDAEIAKAQLQYVRKPFELRVERIEPQRLFSFRWHPYAVDPDVDYSSEPTTLIVFQLEEAEGGILLTVTESGFDQIPLARRVEAFSANEPGWGTVLGLLERYLARPA
jgi:uncharacterized protein YndB with AHSA1/START domain